MIPLKLIQKTELKALLKASDRKYVCQPCPSRGFVALDAKSHQVPPTPLPEHASDESITPTSGGESHSELKARYDHAETIAQHRP
jgi:hypothetical protein